MRLSGVAVQSVCDKESGQDLLFVARRRGTGRRRGGTDRLDSLCGAARAGDNKAGEARSV